MKSEGQTTNELDCVGKDGKIMPSEKQVKTRRYSAKPKAKPPVPEKVLDLITRDGSDGSDGNKCLVKYIDNATPEWVPARDIRQTHPLLLIDYYETRVILRQNEQQLAFDCTTSTDRQLVPVST